MVMKGYVKERGVSDDEYTFLDNFHLMTRTIENLVIKYGANCLSPVYLMPLIDAIHDCRAERDYVPDYNVTLFDIAY